MTARASITSRALGRSMLAAFLLASTPSAPFAQPVKSEPAPFRVTASAWKKLPALPDREGFAGAFAGVANRSLLVAGGANFPGQKPWEGGAKVWSKTIFALDRPGAAWRIAGQLSHPLGYGVSVTTADGLLCIGGSDSQRHHRGAFQIDAADGTLKFKPLPSLPRPAANLSGALMGDIIYVAGGLEKPDSPSALKTFWSLDLRNLEAGWQELDPWPGLGRMLAVAGVHEGSFYLFSGAALATGPDHQVVREWLRDAYRYTPGSGWTRLPDLPRVAVAAPSPAPVLAGRLLILGGDDGTQVKVSPSAHAGFSRQILAFDPRANHWQAGGDLPFALVTTPSVVWHDLLVIPGGESRPGIRSTEVWALAPKQ